MAKKDIDLEFDFEEDFDFDPRAILDSDDSEDSADFDLSEFLGMDLEEGEQAEGGFDDFDIDSLDLGDEPDSQSEEELDLSGLDLGEEPVSEAEEPAPAAEETEPEEDGFGLDDELDLEGMDMDDDMDGIDFDEEDDPDEDLTAGIDFRHRADFFGTEETVQAPVYEADPPFQTPEETVEEEIAAETEEVPQEEKPVRRTRRRRPASEPEEDEEAEEAPRRAPIKFTMPPVFGKLVKLYFPSQEEINAAYEPAKDANGRRRRKPSKVRVFKDFYLPTIIAGLALVLMISFVIGSLSNAIDRKREEDRQAQIQAQQESQEAAQQASEVQALMDKARQMALGYDYEGAITLLSSYTGEPTQEMTALKAEYIDTQSRLVAHQDPSIIPNLSFHCLIHDMPKAMQDDDNLAGQYNRNFVSTSEFTRILEQLYKNGYVLVDYDSIVTSNNGSYFPNTIYLPEGKKPFMLTETMVNYFAYMVDGDNDGVPDAQGDGFANRLVVDANGDIKAEWVDSNGVTQVGDYDLVPILETFIEAHPDFAYKGARATLAVTGSEGIFGYRINTSVISTKGTDYYDQEVVGATKIVEALKEKGYNIACYTFNNENYFNMSAAQVKADLQLWNAQIAPVVGQVDTIVFARATDLGDYTGGKFDVVYDNGFRILVKNADEPYAEVNTTYVRQSRLMVTGNALAWKATMFAEMFDANVVLDLTARGGSVPN